MKYLFIHHTQLLGGGTLSCFDVIKALNSKKNQIFLVLPGNENLYRKYANMHNIEILNHCPPPLTFSYYIGSSSLFKSIIKFIYAIYHINKWIYLFKNEKPDIVILNSIVQWPMLIILKKLKIKSICFVRETMKGRKTNLINRIILRSLNKATGVAFLSEYDKSHWDISDTSKKRLIPDLVDMCVFENVQKHTFSSLSTNDVDTFYVLYVGGMNRLKGARTIVEAMGYLKEQNIKLLFVGDKSEIYNKPRNRVNIKNLKHSHFVRGVYNYIDKHELTNAIEFLGLQNHMNYWYSICDIVVFPATEAHQSRPLYEAGVFKKPVIISDFPNYYEYLKNGYNGLTFDAENSKQLASKIQYLYYNRDFSRRLGEKNYEMTVKYHNSKIINENIQDFFNKIAFIK